MITESNFKNLLLSLGFTNSGERYEKKFPHFETSMSVDFSKKKLYYPDAIKGRERNDGFDAPENFVVFECVNRLFEKGYRPEHIELEKEWHLGHDAKSGRADICVTDRFVNDAEKHITQEGLKNSNARYLNVGDIILSARGTVGVVAQIGIPMTFNQSCYGLRGTAEIDNDYLYYVLTYERKHIESLATGMKFPSIVKSTFDLIQIPVPPIDIQRQVVLECEKIDTEYETTRMSIEAYKQKIEDLFAELDVANMGGTD